MSYSLNCQFIPIWSWHLGLCHVDTTVSTLVSIMKIDKSSVKSSWTMSYSQSCQFILRWSSHLGLRPMDKGFSSFRGGHVIWIYVMWTKLLVHSEVVLSLWYIYFSYDLCTLDNIVSSFMSDLKIDKSSGHLALVSHVDKSESLFIPLLEIEKWSSYSTFFMLCRHNCKFTYASYLKETETGFFSSFFVYNWNLYFSLKLFFYKFIGLYTLKMSQKVKVGTYL